MLLVKYSSIQDVTIQSKYELRVSAEYTFKYFVSFIVSIQKVISLESEENIYNEAAKYNSTKQILKNISKCQRTLIFVIEVFYILRGKNRFYNLITNVLISHLLIDSIFFGLNWKSTLLKFSKKGLTGKTNKHKWKDVIH